MNFHKLLMRTKKFEKYFVTPVGHLTVFGPRVYHLNCEALVFLKI